ncbi:glycosyltransferase [Streptomyces dangxiongensis]|uniref:Glycosyltransferase n=1 Tax=Streptomyces dangxiongensis TaxID=1442032 RepID=A0A3G2JDB8_9ACTN|nr:glycosyltransferase [Streptomyces dangxiongensis]AYN40320.1 glycosyltransferase [Streptomyces dangxiongensis]
MTPERVSVVVPTRDKAGSLRLTLACLADQSCPVPVDVVVVNDAAPPRDGTPDATERVVAEAAGRPSLPVRAVRGPGRGRAAARNAGAAVAVGDLLLFLDDDILLPPTAVAAHVAAHHRDADACVHGPVRDLPGARRLLASTEPGVRRAPYEAVAAGRFGRTVVTALERLVAAMAEGRAPAVAPWLVCIGANTSMPRALWRRSGGYDEGFGTTWGCEDLELGRRLWSLGTRMRLAPDAPGVHLTHERPDRWEQHARTLARFTDKHPEPAVRALAALLGPSGTPDRYLEALRTLEGSTPS